MSKKDDNSENELMNAQAFLSLEWKLEFKPKGLDKHLIKSLILAQDERWRRA